MIKSILPTLTFCLIIALFSFAKCEATTSAKAIVYIPVSMSDESTVIKLPKGRVIFVPVPYTSWGFWPWPYHAITTPYYGFSALPDYVEKEDLNCLSGTKLKFSVIARMKDKEHVGDKVIIDITECTLKNPAHLILIACESVRLTANDERQKQKRPIFTIKGAEADKEKWQQLEKKLNTHDFTKPYDWYAELIKEVEEEEK